MNPIFQNMLARYNIRTKDLKIWSFRHGQRSSLITISLPIVNTLVHKKNCFPAY
jgi:hypothetical protein